MGSRLWGLPSLCWALPVPLSLTWAGAAQTWAQGKGSCGFTGIAGFGNIPAVAVLELLLLGSAVCVPGNVGGFLHFLLNIQGVGATPVVFLLIWHYFSNAYFFLVSTVIFFRLV